MELKTQRLTLAPLGPQYLDAVYAYASDLENTRYMVFLPVESREEAAEFLCRAQEEWAKEEPGFYEFALLFAGRQVGAVSLYLNEERTEGEAGWILHKDYWGRGFALEAAEALFSFATEALHLRKITAHCDTENTSSRRVMEKLGMARAAVHGGRRNRSSPEGEERQEYQYEKLLPIIGLKRGTVEIVPYQPEWAAMAGRIVERLKGIFGDAALDIQHIGSTAVPGIRAKPILDIAVGLEDFDRLAPVLPRLEANRFLEAKNRFSGDRLYVLQDKKQVRTCQIHILIYNSLQWRNYVDFRDYLRAFPDKAWEYEALKAHLAEDCGNVQTAYTDGKHDYMEAALAKARVWAAKEGAV